MPKEIKRDCKKHGITNFVKRKDGGYRCRKCASESSVKKQRARKEELVKLLGGKYMKCGYNKYVGALQFHHINPKEKSFGISSKYQSWKVERLINEVKKCILICANCHAELEDMPL